MNESLLCEIKKIYGQVGSWALWSDSGTSDTSDLSIFNTSKNSNLLNILHTRVVFVALNISGPIDKSRPFGNFHGGKRDFMLRDAIEGTPLKGGYMTDIIKFHPEINSSAVARFFSQHPNKLNEHFATFRRELDDIKATQETSIIALGNLAHDLIQQADLTNPLFKLTHYSSPTLGKTRYKLEVQELSSKLALDQHYGGGA